MIRSVAIGTVFLACEILGRSSGSHAQPLGDVATPDGSLGQGAGWAQGWGFAAPGVYREQNPMIRQRLTGLLHLAHAQAAAQACDQVEVSDKAVRQLFASDSFGALSSADLTFVGAAALCVGGQADSAGRRRGL